MSSQKKFVLYTEESLATTTGTSITSPMTFDMSKRYSNLSSLSADTETSTAMNKSNGIQINAPVSVVAHTSPYYYEKHMLEDHYDDQGLRQGSWETGLCNFVTCAPMTFGFCLALPCISLAQISARLGLTTYRWALARQLVQTIFVLGLPVAAYFLMLKMQEYSDTPPGETKDSKKSKDANGHTPVDAAETLWMLGLWTAFVGWFVVLLLVTLSLADLRLKIRSRCGIPKSRIGDVGQVLFMPTCAIAQMSSHLRCMRPGRYTVQCPETLPPYQY